MRIDFFLVSPFLTLLQSQFIKILDNGTLVFFSSSLQNAGTYSCVASNIVTRSEASAELTVEGTAVWFHESKPMAKRESPDI